MNADVRHSGEGRRPDSPVRRIDATCDRFEAAWRAGREPRIEDFLADAEAADRPALLRELLALEVELRRGRGECATPADYRDRFPGQADVIDAAFAATDTRPGIRQPELNRKPTDAGRNLLFGLLALQNNFVSRESILAAFTAWVAEKSRPLGRILRDLGALDECRHALLEALIAEHLKLHGDDPERTLAALGSIGAICNELKWINDTDLQASIAATRSSPGGSNGDGQSAAGDPSMSRRAGERYRILRFHREGGLGRVYVARDEELGREVALKEIRPDMVAEADLRGRFLLEAEINGGLEHPGIVPVYSLGTYDDGRPFYAMRLVRGRTLKEAIEEFHRDHPHGSDPSKRSLALRALLRRLIDVCNAVDYAHSRGVVHRDLKPANVMLGSYGETLVVDWGLAKCFERPDPPTGDGETAPHQSPVGDVPASLTGSVSGTPAFMSPEQAEGKPGRITSATDVYSLGATLYTILTGRPPFDGESVQVILRKVREGELTPPRMVNPSVSRPLEAVCLKAMSLRVEERYHSPRTLADDLERWLGDEPVSAWREPWSARAHRFMRRHRAGVFASTSTLLMVSLALGISMAVVAAKNVMLDRESRRADANAAFLLQGLTESLKRLANPALARDPECRESALAALREGETTYLDLMDSERRLGTSPSRISALWVHVALLRTAAGDRQGTLDAYQSAIEATTAAETLQFGNSGPLIDAAGVRMHLGLDLWVRGERTEATEQLRRAATGFRHALGLVPEDPALVRNAAWFHLFCPDLRIRDSRLALELAESFVRREDSRGRDRPRFSEGIRPLFALALAHYRVGHPTTARNIIEESIRRKAKLLGTTMERLVEARSAIDAYDWFVWSMTLARLGEFGAARSRFDEAETWMRRNRYGDFELHLLKKEAEELLLQGDEVGQDARERLGPAPRLLPPDPPPPAN
jgi:serine/threonine protein kinase